jgi:hypothetical protein
MLARIREKGSLIHCWWECKQYNLFGKQYGGFLKKLNIDLPYAPVIPLLCRQEKM